MDYDLDATTRAKNTARSGLIEGSCGDCGRAMYKEVPYPGVPNEWRHKSTGQPLSWSPDKHIAGIGQATPHQHRFPNQGTKGVLTCEVVGCDATLTPNTPLPKEHLTGKQARDAESRKRGQKNSRVRPLGGGVGF